MIPESTCCNQDSLYAHPPQVSGSRGGLSFNSLGLLALTLFIASFSYMQTFAQLNSIRGPGLPIKNLYPEASSHSALTKACPGDSRAT